MARDHILPPRFGRALTAGAGTGAGLPGAIAFLAGVFTANPGIMTASVFMFIATFVVFVLGLWIIGLPCWIVFNHLGWTRMSDEIVLGAIGVGATCFAIGASPPGQDDWSMKGVLFGGTMSLDGAVVGYVIWRIAYRTPEDRPKLTAELFA